MEGIGKVGGRNLNRTKTEGKKKKIKRGGKER